MLCRQRLRPSTAPHDRQLRGTGGHRSGFAFSDPGLAGFSPWRWIIPPGDIRQRSRAQKRHAKALAWPVREKVSGDDGRRSSAGLGNLGIVFLELGGVVDIPPGPSTNSPLRRPVDRPRPQPPDAHLLYAAELCVTGEAHRILLPVGWHAINVSGDRHRGVRLRATQQPLALANISPRRPARPPWRRADQQVGASAAAPLAGAPPGQRPGVRGMKPTRWYRRPRARPAGRERRPGRARGIGQHDRPVAQPTARERSHCPRSDAVATQRHPSPPTRTQSPAHRQTLSARTYRATRP
jgi:hypothetical protein